MFFKRTVTTNNETVITSIVPSQQRQSRFGNRPYQTTITGGPAGGGHIFGKDEKEAKKIHNGYVEWLEDIG